MDRPLETQLLQRDPSREYQTCREGEGERERRWREGRRRKEGGEVKCVREETAVTS
jgi:hypothetical protein